MTVLDRSAILERERRWARPAGFAGIAGSLAVQIGLLVGGAALDADSSAERLLEASRGDADGQLLLGVAISALGFLLLGGTLTYLFLAARARSERVRRPFLGFGLLGAVLIASGVILNNFSYRDAADSFATAEAKREAAPAPAPAQESGSSKQQGGEGSAAPGTGGGAAKGGAGGAAGGTTTVAPTTTGTSETDSTDAAEQAEDDADDRAKDELKDAPGATASAVLVRGGALTFAIGLLYTSLWAMRTGLLTRFWGSLGMASAVVLALFFLYFFALIWFLAIGLLVLGRWIGGRPPAWEAGTAVPWPKGGEPPPDARDPQAGQDRGTVEGEGRDISDLPAPGEGDSPGEKSPPTEPPRKRKRRS